ncbi:MAG: ankyrin repeat domain-containing protein [Bacteroidales bacterium]
MIFLKRFILLATIAVSFSLSGFCQTSRNYNKQLLDKINLELLTQADSGNLEKVLGLIEVGGNPNALSWDGVSALMYASQNGHYKVARELIAYGAKLNTRTPYDYTALHYATIHNNDSIAELLILNGAEVNPQNYLGITPLHYASAYGYPFLTDLLVYYGAEIDKQDKYGNTPLLSAVYSGALTSTEILLEAWADVNIADNNGYTPLMVASQFNDTTTIQLLIDYGADIYQRNDKGATALALALEVQAEEAAYQILKNRVPKEELHEQRSYADLAKQKGLNAAYIVLSELGSPTLRTVRIDALTYSGGATFNGNDFYFSGNITAEVNKLGLYLDVGLSTRPYYKATAVEKEFETYQFFERRSIATLGASKEFLTWYRAGGKNRALTFGMISGVSWGRYNYPNYQAKPKVYGILSPILGYHFNKDNFHFSIDGFILDMNHTKRNPVTIRMKFGYYIDFSKPKIIQKKINWF